MEIGKIPNELLEKLIIDPINGNIRNKDVLVRPGIGLDCAAVSFGGDILALTSDPITAADKGAGSLLLHVCCNDIAAIGAEPIGILITVLMPKDSSQKQLEEILNAAFKTAAELNIEILGGHTEVTDAVVRPVISGTAVGSVKDGRLTPSSGAQPGDDIIITKWAGIEGSVILAKEITACPSSPGGFSELGDAAVRALEFEKYLSVINDAKTAKSNGANAMHDATEGGVLGACIEVARSSGLSLSIDISKIPIKDETRKICGYFGINPYRLIASGSLIVAAPDGDRLARNLINSGINAAVIGKMSGNESVIIDLDGKTKPLDNTCADELYKALDMIKALRHT